MFVCTVQYHDQETGVQYKGAAKRIFTTAVFKGELNFTIAPKIGTPFETDFTLSISKENRKLKCEFGYYNKAGRVVIPTNDTADFLNNSE